jgi:hypothetical protein
LLPIGGHLPDLSDEIEADDAARRILIQKNGVLSKRLTASCGQQADEDQGESGRVHV